MDGAESRRERIQPAVQPLALKPIGAPLRPRPVAKMYEGIVQQSELDLLFAQPV
jgi:hypothetical protein